ncbi:hypothetical protein EC957_008485 [Mortierella hygrophila]|uniref:XPG-I domain-containing protein n=1 Tax=Mortierella hygrophila TaxID=979708 RepID=A0A9P6EX15_9FUNG|nr:hypothetical protein EC957_008485 [Mortierella hygrophila]
MSLYLDGPQAVEKSATAETRDSKRQKATEKLPDSLDTFEMRINTGSRVRKRHYDDIKKSLGSSFYWSLDSRKDFAQHMTGQGWIAEVCDTEADVKIARDARPWDIIISGDSDSLGYANIHTLWPLSPNILKTIGFSREQLTALAVVSKNDYQRNIKGLGPASNFGVIKKIGHSRLIIAAYLSDPTVITKNELEATFKDSIRVFVEMRQQVMNPLRPNPTQTVYHALQERFRDLCQKRESLKDVKGSEAQLTPVEEPIMTLKFYKQPPETSAKSLPKPKTNAEKAPTSAKKPLTEMKKIGLVRSLAWRHPTVSLEVGTINANTKRVFLVFSGGMFAGVFPSGGRQKREAQRLIGIFVETLRIRMDSAEEALRIKLPPGKLTVSEEQRTKAHRDAVSDTERKILDHLCERIKPKDDDEDDDDDAADKKRENNSDLDEKANDQEGFLLSFLTFLYSGNYPRERDLKGFGARDLLPKDKDDDGDKDRGKKEKISPGIVVNYLIEWLVAGHFYKPSRRRDEIEVKMPYTPTDVVRSVAGQLAVELKKLYGNGSHELRKKVLTVQKKGVLDASIDIGIRE